MKRLLFCIFLPFSLSILHAQPSYLSGTIFEENNKVINYASITLFSKDSVFIVGALTEQDGSYLLKTDPGEYLLQVQALGFQKISQTINIPSYVIKKNFYLFSDTVALDEVVVVTKKPLIKREADRIIFEANSIAAGANDALDILKNVPGVIVSNDGIKILGQQGVKVLINEKDTKVNDNDLAALLKSYQAEQIDKIEVILAPPSKFDAEGSAGILNIKLKRAKIDYLSSTLNYAYSDDNYGVHELNANFIYNRNRINAALNLGGASGKTQYREQNREEHDRYDRKNLSKALNNTDAYNFRGNVDYRVTEALLVGALATYNKNKNNRNLDGESAFYPSNSFILDSLLLSENPGSKITDNYRGNIYSELKMDSLGKKINIDIDYIYSEYSSESQFESKSYRDNMQYIGGDYGFNNDNSREVNSFTTAVDFTLPYKNYTISFGAKISLSKTENIINYYNQPSLEDQNDDFRFDENIYALYADFSKDLTEKLSFKSGLRVEHTLTKGKNRFINNSLQNKEEYTRFFPTLYFGYKLNPEHQFNFSISSRISRPSFRNINPFVLYTGKYSTVSGKADLKPSYVYKINLGYTLKGNFTVDAFYSYKTDGFTQIQKMDADNLTLNTFWDNVLDVHTIGINNSCFFNKIKWLQLFFVHGLNYERSHSNSVYTISQRDILMYIAMLNSSVFLNNRKTFTCWLNASYNSTEKLATTDLQSMYNINLGCQYKTLDNNLKISMSLNNIIASHVKGNINSPDFKMYFDNKYNYSTVKLSLTYTIGAKLRGKRYQNTEIENRL